MSKKDNTIIAKYEPTREITREIWTAKEEKDDKIIFEVKDEQTQKVLRQEERYKTALPLMFELSGYPPQRGAIMLMQPLPWRFRKVGDHIYIDGPSVGIKGYHPIDD